MHYNNEIYNHFAVFVVVVAVADIDGDDDNNIALHRTLHKYEQYSC